MHFIGIQFLIFLMAFKIISRHKKLLKQKINNGYVQSAPSSSMRSSKLSVGWPLSSFRIPAGRSQTPIWYNTAFAAKALAWKIRSTGENCTLEVSNLTFLVSLLSFGTFFSETNTIIDCANHRSTNVLWPGIFESIENWRSLTWDGRNPRLWLCFHHCHASKLECRQAKVGAVLQPLWKNLVKPISY